LRWPCVSSSYPRTVTRTENIDLHLYIATITKAVPFGGNIPGCCHIPGASCYR
jgi:hypothetical protein